MSCKNTFHRPVFLSGFECTLAMLDGVLIPKLPNLKVWVLFHWSRKHKSGKDQSELQFCTCLWHTQLLSHRRLYVLHCNLSRISSEKLVRCPLKTNKLFCRTSKKFFLPISFDYVFHPFLGFFVHFTPTFELKTKFLGNTWPECEFDRLPNELSLHTFLGKIPQCWSFFK